jgi:hypothetical protein
MAEEQLIDQKIDTNPQENDVDIDNSQSTDNKTLSVRDELKSALKTVKERESGESDGKERTDDGKFKAVKVDQSTEKTVATVNPAKEVALAPEGLPAEIKAEWAKLPASVQGALTKREAEIHKGMTAMDEERKFSKEMQNTILPYMTLINAENSTPVKAVQSLLNTAHVLRTSSPQQKGALLWQLAQQYGADMRSTPQTQAQPQNQIQTLQQQLAETQAQLAKMPETFKQQQEDANLQQIISTFAADPKNAHYTRVKPVMAALLSSGQAKDMQDAYDQACYANPEIRSTLLAQQTTDTKRIANIQAKAGAARSAAVSVKGGAGVASAPAKKYATLREELQAHFRTATEH